MLQSVHAVLDGLSAGSWWLVKVTAAPTRPGLMLEIAESTARESVVEWKPLENFCGDSSRRIFRSSNARYCW